MSYEISTKISINSRSATVRTENSSIYIGVGVAGDGSLEVRMDTNAARHFLNYLVAATHLVEDRTRAVTNAQP